MEDGPNVKCAFCEKVQPMCWARPVTGRRFVCRNQSLPSVKGCRGDLWEIDFPDKRWQDWTYEEHASQQMQQKMHALEQKMKTANL